MNGYVVWHRAWLIWACLSFGSFLVLELYALSTDSKRTLSAAIWHFEKVHKGQPITAWTFAHFAFIGLLLLLDIWLLGHFGFQWWT